MIVERLQVGVLGANCYIVKNESILECIVIDSGGDYNRIIDKTKGYSIKGVLFTHGHFDHIGAGASFKRQGVPLYIGEEDRIMTSSNHNLSKMAGIEIEKFACDFSFKDGDMLNLAGFNIKCILIGGHSLGSYCFLIDNYLFSGDTLFCGSVGRTDFPNGSFSTLINNVKNKLLCLDGDTIVLSGHDEQTTIEEEKLYNPFLNGYED